MANWVICSALANYERAQAIFVADEEPRSLAVVDLNLASIAQAHGQYRDALRRLHAVLEQTAAHCPRFGLTDMWLLQQSMIFRRVVKLLLSHGRKVIAAAGN
jgi:hypothetical protein